ncbi:unnamed protein product [Phytophthora lilii]|uniref:Unnamed protein product n=1 Tax=Phytophthora lilii TaxID=2077276 RepID=A0A9W7CHU1_9STRA|nr:unnamed protein product [Phytophthora lilii]
MGSPREVFRLAEKKMDTQVPIETGAKPETTVATSTRTDAGSCATAVTMSSDTLRYRSKTAYATATGLLLQRFQNDTQRSRNMAQARNSTKAKLGLEIESSTDVVQTLINAARFDQFILLLILANSVILAIADYSKVDEQGDLDSSQSIRNAIVNSADRLFTILFAVECSMKIIAMGLFGEQGAYLMDPWNWMDFIVVFLGYFDDFSEYNSTVLANYSHFPCVDEYNELIPLSNGSWSHDSSPWRAPRVCYWPVAQESTARTCALGDDQFRQCPDGQDAGSGAVAVIYFVSFIIFGSFFMLNLTLAVIWDNFSEASFLEAEERKALKKAKAAALALRAAQASRDRVSNSRVQILFGAIVNHWMFNVVQTVLILLNTIILSLDQYPIDQKLNETVEKINFALTLAFFLEALLKIVGLGWKGWCEDRYNLFDAMVVLISAVEMILSPPAFIHQKRTSSKTASFSGLRSFRLFALFKLAR